MDFAALYPGYFALPDEVHHRAERLAQLIGRDVADILAGTKVSRDTDAVASRQARVRKPTDKGESFCSSE